jgi:hypothetical protein
MTFGPLRWVIATPQFHHWHHAREPQAYNTNYAGEFPVLDALFGPCTFPRTVGPSSTASITLNQLAICVSLPGRYTPRARPTLRRRAHSWLGNRLLRSGTLKHALDGRPCYGSICVGGVLNMGSPGGGCPALMM